MILFVFEGVKREPDLFRTIQRLYFANRDEQIVCSYNNNTISYTKICRSMMAMEILCLC